MRTLPSTPPNLIATTVTHGPSAGHRPTWAPWRQLGPLLPKGEETLCTVDLWTAGRAGSRLTAQARSPMDKPWKTLCVSHRLPTGRRLTTSSTALKLCTFESGRVKTLPAAPALAWASPQTVAHFHCIDRKRRPVGTTLIERLGNPENQQIRREKWAHRDRPY